MSPVAGASAEAESSGRRRSPRPPGTRSTRSCNEIAASRSRSRWAPRWFSRWSTSESKKSRRASSACTSFSALIRSLSAERRASRRASSSSLSAIALALSITVVASTRAFTVIASASALAWATVVSAVRCANSIVRLIVSASSSLADADEPPSREPLVTCWETSCSLATAARARASMAVAWFWAVSIAAATFSLKSSTSAWSYPFLTVLKPALRTVCGLKSMSRCYAPRAHRSGHTQPSYSPLSYPPLRGSTGFNRYTPVATFSIVPLSP